MRVTTYVDIVTVRTIGKGDVLRTAPFMSGLKIGDEVEIEWGKNDYDTWTGDIIDIATFNVERDEYKLLFGFVPDMKKRVLKKIIYKELDWRGEDNG